MRRNKAKRRLPPIILMTDARRLPDPLPVVAGLAPGSAVILRHYDDPQRHILARRLARLCRRRGLVLLVAGDRKLAARVGADGVHFPQGLAHLARACRRQQAKQGWLITAAAHDSAAIARAARCGADAVLLSPVFKTASHPEATPLGPLRFARLARRSRLPVYALGGVNPVNGRRLKRSGAVGLAGISLFL